MKTVLKFNEMTFNGKYVRSDKDEHISVKEIKKMAPCHSSTDLWILELQDGRSFIISDDFYFI